MTTRHDPTPDCDGTPAAVLWRYATGLTTWGPVVCPECEQHLCPCEHAHGHDCEV